MVRLAFLFGLLLINFALDAQPLPSEFYLVSYETSDIEGFWRYSILEAQPKALGSLIQYTVIEPARIGCREPVAIRTISSLIANVTPAELAEDFNPCVNGSRDRGPRTPAVGLGRIVKSGIVAKCGEARSAGDVKNLFQLESVILRRAFMGKDSLYGITAQEDLVPQIEGEAKIPALQSGDFDPGLKAIRGNEPGVVSFATILRQHTGPVRTSEFVQGELKRKATYHFRTFVEPEYLNLGIASAIDGSATIALDVDSSSGAVRRATPISGQQDISEHVAAAARRWVFEPGTIPSNPINIEYQFSFRCPAT